MYEYEKQFAKYTKLSEREYNNYSELIEAVKAVSVDRSGDPIANAVVLLGFSGNGKTTWINNFVQENPSYEVLSMDSVQRSLGDRAEPSMIVREFARRLEEICSNGKNIVIDGNFLNLLTRSALLDSLKTFKYQVNIVDITNKIGDILPIRILDRTAQVLGYKITRENIQNVLKTSEFSMCRREILEYYMNERIRSNFDEQIQYGVIYLGADNSPVIDTTIMKGTSNS